MNAHRRVFLSMSADTSYKTVTTIKRIKMLESIITHLVNILKKVYHNFFY